MSTTKQLDKPQRPVHESENSSLHLPQSPPPKKRRSWWTLSAGSLILLVLGSLTIGLFSEKPTTAQSQEPGEKSPNPNQKDQAPQPWYRPITEIVNSWMPGQERIPADLLLKGINRSRFRITINEKGYLNSQKNETLSSLVPGSTTIISIVPEGKFVQKGDIVCELDSSALEEKARQQEIDMTKAESAMSAARENVEIQINQNASDIAIATLALELAALDLQKYLEGELPQQRNSILGQIRLKEETLARKRESYEFTKRMAKKGYRSLSDLEAERIAVTQAEIELKVEQENLRVLENFTSKRDIAQLKSDATEFERELERVKKKADAALSKAQSEYEACKLTLQVEKEKYQEWLTQIGNCKLRASQNGEVVYANQNSSNRRGNNEPDIYEGATVRERQAIINIPDNSRMKIDARIHESMISKLRVGQPVLIRADAQPGEVYHGVVSDISSVPLSGSFPNFDLKEYQVGINLTDSSEKVGSLRPGLSANFEVVVDDRDNVLQAPIQSVVQIGRKYYSWVVQGQRITRRQVQIGSSNGTDIEILDGLDAGEQVVMNPRSKFATEITELSAGVSVNGAENPPAGPGDSARGDAGGGAPRGQRAPGLETPAADARPGHPGGAGDGVAPAGERPAGPRPGMAGEGKPRPEWAGSKPVAAADTP